VNGTLGATTASTANVTTLTTSSTVTHNGGTANGVAYLNGSKVLTTGSALVFDGSNLGLGVTPSAWTGAEWTAFEGAYGGALAFYKASNVPVTVLTSNAYNNSGWKYKTTDPALQYEMDGNGGTYKWYQAASGTAGNAISFTQAMTLDASGNLGVGVTSPVSRIDARAASAAMGNYQTIQAFSTDTSAAIDLGGGISLGGFYNSTQFAQFGSIAGRKENGTSGNYAGYLQFGTNSQATGVREVMRLDSSGNLLVGATSASLTNSNSQVFGGGANNYSIFSHVNGTGSGAVYHYFAYNGSSIGSITQNGTTGVLYNLTSDYRLKNDQQSLTGAKDFIMALKPKKWQWWDGSGEGVGFVAHEFMEVAKYSGHGEKDAVDADGKPVYQSIQPSSSEVMANLVALIQEQQALIQTLTARITALESA
jgi:hypothetical protein